MRRLSFPILVIAFALSARADMQATQPTILPVDTPEVKAVRDSLLQWDKDEGKMSLEEVRKLYHTDNDREAVYMDWLAHENWEEGKTEQAIRDKWGSAAAAEFAHLQDGSTYEDDQVCDIKVDGDRAVASWNIKDSTPLPMIKVDGKWFVDGHAMFEQGLKDNPNMETDRQSTGKLMKSARDDIEQGKFDDADSFLADFKKKLTSPDGN
jgi:hypothetical protein